MGEAPFLMSLVGNNVRRFPWPQSTIGREHHSKAIVDDDIGAWARMGNVREISAAARQERVR